MKFFTMFKQDTEHKQFTGLALNPLNVTFLFQRN